MNIALLGPSGVGKGTQSARLCERYHLHHICPGDLFRRNVRTRSALGLLAERYMAGSELVPDEVVEAMIASWADTLAPEQGILFDGFPRTSDQVHFLDALLRGLGRELDALIYLQVPDAEIIKRLNGRLVCQKCQMPFHTRYHIPKKPGLCDQCGSQLDRRPDDPPELVCARLRVFHRATVPVLLHYAAAGKLLIVPGEGAIDAVDSAVVASLDGIKNRSTRFVSVEEVAALFATPSPPPAPLLISPHSLGLVLLGGPGSGKGTQAEQLAAFEHLPHIATGDLFRENLRQGSALGQLAKSYMDRGELVPDDVTDAIVEDRLARPDTGDGFILDGFPRTLPQALTLMEILARQKRSLAGVIYIQVPDTALIARLSGRLICSRCQAPYHQQFKPPQQRGTCDHCGGDLQTRADDAPDTVRSRLVTFHRQTQPLIAHFRQLGLLHEIAGEGDVAAVTRRVLGVVQGLGMGPARAEVLEPAET